MSIVETGENRRERLSYVDIRKEKIMEAQVTPHTKQTTHFTLRVLLLKIIP